MPIPTEQQLEGPFQAGGIPASLFGSQMSPGDVANIVQQWQQLGGFGRGAASPIAAASLGAGAAPGPTVEIPTMPRNLGTGGLAGADLAGLFPMQTPPPVTPQYPNIPIQNLGVPNTDWSGGMTNWGAAGFGVPTGGNLGAGGFAALGPDAVFGASYGAGVLPYLGLGGAPAIGGAWTPRYV